MNFRNKLAEMPIRPLLYTMAVPLMLSLLVQSLYNIVDSIFVAKLSETALTAASLVYSVQFLMIAVGVGTAVGLNALLSRKIGEHKTEEACQAATTGLFLMLLTSLIFSIVGIFLSDTIASKMAANPELQTLCKQYLSINFVYCWGIFLHTYGQRLLQAIGSIMTFAVNSILLPVSATAVAFFGIYYKLQNFLMMPLNGLGQAAIPIVGYNYGDKKYQRVQQTLEILLPTGAIIALCGTVIFWCFPGQLLQLFSASQEMLTLGIPALRIISVSFVMAAITILCGYFASGLGNGIINMISAAIRQLILLIPCLLIFIKISGISNGWYAFWIAEIVACIYSYYMSHKLLKTISQS